MSTGNGSMEAEVSVDFPPNKYEDFVAVYQRYSGRCRVMGDERSGPNRIYRLDGSVGVSRTITLRFDDDIEGSAFANELADLVARNPRYSDFLVALGQIPS
jgi:hypothetical protein